MLRRVKRSTRIKLAKGAPLDVGSVTRRERSTRTEGSAPKVGAKEVIKEVMVKVIHGVKVVVNGKKINCGAVLSNANLKNTIEKLLGLSKLASEALDIFGGHIFGSLSDTERESLASGKATNFAKWAKRARLSPSTAALCRY